MTWEIVATVLGVFTIITSAAVSIWKHSGPNDKPTEEHRPMLTQYNLDIEKRMSALEVKVDLILSRISKAD